MERARGLRELAGVVVEAAGRALGRGRAPSPERPSSCESRLAGAWAGISFLSGYGHFDTVLEADQTYFLLLPWLLIVQVCWPPGWKIAW